MNQRSVMLSTDADIYATVKSKAAIASALAMITQNVAIILTLFNNTSSLSARAWVTFALALINCLICFTIGCLSLLLADRQPISPPAIDETQKQKNPAVRSPSILRESRSNAQGANEFGESYQVINFEIFHQQINRLIQYLTYVVLVINIPIVALAAKE